MNSSACISSATMRAGRIGENINRERERGGTSSAHRPYQWFSNTIARPVRCRKGLAIAVSGSGAGVKKAAASRSGKFCGISLVELEGSQADPTVGLN